MKIMKIELVIESVGIVSDWLLYFFDFIFVLMVFEYLIIKVG